MLEFLEREVLFGSLCVITVLLAKWVAPRPKSHLLTTDGRAPRHKKPFEIKESFNAIALFLGSSELSTPNNIITYN